MLPDVLLSSSSGCCCSLVEVVAMDDSESGEQPVNPIPGDDDGVLGGVRDAGHLPLPLSGCTD